MYEARNGERRPSLVYSGDDEEAKAEVATLIRDLGFDPVDAEGDDGPAIAYRFER